MVSKSLYFLPAWQKAKRDPNYMVETALFTGMFYCPSRCGHNAVCVNEDLIIWGGYSEPDYGEASYCEKDGLWVYNMDNDFWFSVKTTGESPLYRSGAMSVLIWPYWYIIGGHTYAGDVNDIHAINLLTLEWEVVKTSGTVTLSKRDKASAWYWQNRIYCFGGYGPCPYDDLWRKSEDSFVMELSTDRGWNNQIAYLDMKVKEWVRPQCEGSKPLPRAAHSSTIVRNEVYVYGGRHKSKRLNDLHRLDLESHTWSGRITCLGEAPCGRSWHSMTNVDSSSLLLFGGFSNGNVPLEDCWLLNIKTYSWSLLSKNTGTPRLWHSACVNSYRDILVFGGCVSNIIDDTIPLITSDKVLLFRTQPFTLQRLCLHSLFAHREKTEHLWEQLPRDFNEWLCNKNAICSSFSPDYYEHTAELGHGPSLSSLSVISAEEADRRNAELKDKSS